MIFRLLPYIFQHVRIICATAFMIYSLMLCTFLSVSSFKMFLIIFLKRHAVEWVQWPGSPDKGLWASYYAMFVSSKYAQHCGNVGEHHHIEILICDEALSIMYRYAFLVTHLEEEEGTTDTSFQLSKGNKFIFSMSLSCYSKTWELSRYVAAVPVDFIIVLKVVFPICCCIESLLPLIWSLCLACACAQL